MTDVVNGADAAEEPVEPSKAAAGTGAVDDQLVGMLVDRARAEGLQLTGEGGLQQLTKRGLESALDSGMSDHLGYDKHDAAGRNGGNSRNGRRAKTGTTDAGPVKVNVPRDVRRGCRRRSPCGSPSAALAGSVRAAGPGRAGWW